MRLRTTSNIDDVLKAFDQLEQDIIGIAGPRALNTLANQADVAGRRKIRDIYGISTGDLAPYFDVVIASTSNLEAKIVAKGKGFPLKFFKPRQTKEGVVATIKGKTVLFRHAFLPKGGLDTTQVFARGRYGPGGPSAARPRKGKRKSGLGANVFRSSGESMGRFAFGLGRFPITLLRSSSAPDALSNPDVVEAMNDRVSEQAAKVLEREMKAVARGF